jgi:hypothetical protein
MAVRSIPELDQAALTFAQRILADGKCLTDGDISKAIKSVSDTLIVDRALTPHERRMTGARTLRALARTGQAVKRPCPGTSRPFGGKDANVGYWAALDTGGAEPEAVNPADANSGQVQLAARRRPSDQEVHADALRQIRESQALDDNARRMFELPACEKGMTDGLCRLTLGQKLFDELVALDGDTTECTSSIGKQQMALGVGAWRDEDYRECGLEPPDIPRRIRRSNVTFALTPAAAGYMVDHSGGFDNLIEHTTPGPFGGNTQDAALAKQARFWWRKMERAGHVGQRDRQSMSVAAVPEAVRPEIAAAEVAADAAATVERPRVSVAGCTNPEIAFIGRLAEAMTACKGADIFATLDALQHSGLRMDTPCTGLRQAKAAAVKALEVCPE